MAGISITENARAVKILETRGRHVKLSENSYNCRKVILSFLNLPPYNKLIVTYYNTKI